MTARRTLTRRQPLAHAALGGAAQAAGGAAAPAVLAAGPVEIGLLVSYSKVYGQLGQDIIDGMTPLTLQNPENLAFTRADKARFKRDASVFAMQGYDAARVIVETLNKTGGDTSNKDGMIEALAGVTFASPRDAFEFDPSTHNVIQTIYVRQVRQVGGDIANVVFDTLGRIADPGK